jgi:CMP-N-acetylneuraminic acid synthetase
MLKANDEHSFIMPRQNSIDIVTEEDWSYVEYCAFKISKSSSQ